jgi:N-acetylmuramoyl-L-alanine amidase
MRPATYRGGLLLALGCALLSRGDAAGNAPRSAPSRPGAVARSHGASPGGTVKIAGIECVSVARAAKHLGLHLSARDNGRTLLLTGNGTRAELQADTRDITVNGLRVFLGWPVAASRGELFISRIDFERSLSPLLRPGLGVAPLAPPRVVVIDPGHGGRDHGKINDQLGLNEKSVTLDTARRLKKLLENDGYRVVLTRDDDRYIELAERSAIANRAKADLFISIHFNAIDKDRKTSGVEVYTFVPQYQRSTESWMAGQKDDSQPTPEPANEFDYWNALLAQSLHRPFVAGLKAPDRGKKIMHLGVLRSLRCPGALVECGFLTSDTEARKIATPAYRQQLAEALRDGLRDYTEQMAGLRQAASTTATSTRARTSPPS